MRLLDLFCGAGGASKGYHDAGFDEIVGVDNQPQKCYPYDFVLGDALEYVAAHGHEFDVIHASPPCQAYSITKSLHNNSHPDLVAKTREALIATGKPYVIENVPGAPLNATILLCGSMFGLKIIRHRYFETWPVLPLILMPPCNHQDSYRPYNTQTEKRTTKKFQKAMGIDWMPPGGGAGNGKTQMGTLSQAIPPAYTEFIGRHMIKFIRSIT